MKTLLAVVAVLLAACGETTAAGSGPCWPTCPHTESAAPSPSLSESPTQAQTVVTFLNAPLTMARGQNATLKDRTAPNTKVLDRGRLQVRSIYCSRADHKEL